MRIESVRVLVAIACVLGLAGCETVGPPIPAPPPIAPTTTLTNAQLADADSTSSIQLPDRVPTALPGEDPKDDLVLGKRHFRDANYGLAEVHFRRAAESPQPEARRAAEAWLGLAASYDHLRRFELADRAYEQAYRILGPTPELLNNHGYSYLIRGDLPRAREKLLAARAKDPDSPYILRNLSLLKQSEGRGRLRR
jgi:Flp pilus assembly protein TadD